MKDSKLYRTIENMKAIIFAGGVGTRLWPLSRKKSPKQFEKVLGNKSTLQLTVERLLPEFKPEDIYISTGKQYISIIHEQLPMLPQKNIIGEPFKKDVGPAVAYAMGYVAKKTNADEPVVILWSDHLVKHQKKFTEVLLTAETVIKNDPSKIVFIGQKPRFPSENLGWIAYNSVARKENNIDLYTFGGLKYKPDKNLAQTYFADGRHCWNLGYFVATPKHVMSLYERFVPAIHKHLQNILSHFDGPDYERVLNREYDRMPIINFDNALLEQLGESEAYVIVEDIGWSDVGAWEALKEALEERREDNITNGRVLLEDSIDNLVYNYENHKLIVGIDLDDLLVVNTQDVILVAKKSSVAKIKKLVESFQGTENESLT